MKKVTLPDKILLVRFLFKHLILANTVAGSWVSVWTFLKSIASWSYQWQKSLYTIELANHLDWKVFFSYSVFFSAQALHLLTFSDDSLLPQPYSVFIIIKYMSIVNSRMLSTLCVWFVFVYDWQKNITFGTPIKKNVMRSRLSFSKLQ